MCSGVSEFVEHYFGLMADNVNVGTITHFTRGGNKKGHRPQDITTGFPLLATPHYLSMHITAMSCNFD